MWFIVHGCFRVYSFWCSGACCTHITPGGLSDADADEVTYMDPHKRRREKVGAFAGVFVPTCENMWGVLIFLRFYAIVGYAGVGQALCGVFLSFLMAFFTTCSMSAMASSGGLLSEGGPYFMISRAMGPTIGATVGLLYWLGISLLAVLETLGKKRLCLNFLPSFTNKSDTNCFIRRGCV